MLYQLRYRKPQMVCTDLIEASDYPTAQKVGQKYCDTNPGYKFIGIYRAVVADESILADAVVPAVAQAPLMKPDQEEQKRRLAQQHTRTENRIGA